MRYQRWGRWRLQLTRRQKIAVSLLALLFIVLQIIMLIDRNLRPTLEAIAEARAKVIAKLLMMLLRPRLPKRLTMVCSLLCIPTIMASLLGHRSIPWSQSNRGCYHYSGAGNFG